MKQRLSPYLKDSIKNVKEIVEELSKEYKYVSILGNDIEGKKYSVGKAGSEVTDLPTNERGFVLRIHNGYGYSEYSFNELKKKDVIKKAKMVAEKDIAFYKSKGMKFVKYPILDDEAVQESFRSNLKYHPDAADPLMILDKLEELRDRGVAEFPSVVNLKLSLTTTQISKIFITNKKDLRQSYVFTEVRSVAFVRDGDKIESDSVSYVEMKGLEMLRKLERHYKKSITRAMELLNAERIKPGEYEIICAPEVSGQLAHEALGHGVEMDMFVKDRSKVKNYLDKRIASGVTNLEDGSPLEDDKIFLFDDEGTFSKNSGIIKDGMLTNGICDNLSALLLDVNPTGNGRRESFERKAYSRINSVYFTEGNSSLDEMITSVKNGYLLEGYESGMEDPKNMGIQCIAKKAKEIVDGKFTGKVVAPVVLSGDALELLNSISMVSDNIQTFGTCECSKGYKETIRTSIGGPYIKAVGRLS